MLDSNPQNMCHMEGSNHTHGLFTLGVVVVYFLWFYFHRKGIINVNHPTLTITTMTSTTLGTHQPPFSMLVTSLEMVVHAHFASLESFKVKVRGES